METTPTAQPDSAEPESQVRALRWKNQRTLQFINLYRAFVGLLFAALYIGGYAQESLSLEAPRLFIGASLGYIAVALAAALLQQIDWPPIKWQTRALTCLDILIVTLITYASGGVSSGLGMLLIPPLSATSTRLAPRMAGFFAALATVCMLLQQWWYLVHIGSPTLSLAQAGLLGAVFFVAALVSSALTQRARASEALAQQRSEDLANLAELNERIIQHMQMGVVVVSADGQLRTVNDAARALLDVQAVDLKSRLADMSTALEKAFNAWREAPGQSPPPFGADDGEGVILPHFMRLGESPDAPVLVLLEDERRIGERAQQMKLAALGQLTASIAHQVRNPLGAIGHAAQLLGESPHLQDDDHKLISIVHRHTARINQIVEDILRLSRRETSGLKTLALKPMIEQFAREFREAHPSIEIDFDLQRLQPDMELRADASQMQQIMNNLWENSLRHGSRGDRPPRITVSSGYAGVGHRPYIDVADDGPGIEPDVAERLFDPFFTTSRSGAGLGLYIVRELCGSNGASIHYHSQRNGGFFRITFNLRGWAEQLH